MIKKTFTYITFTALWLVNPIYLGGCFDTEAEFSFGEAEMLTLLDTINEQSWTVEQDDSSYELTFSLEQASSDNRYEGASLDIMDSFASAYACSSRSFAAEASACIDDTFLPIIGTVTIVETETDTIVAEDISLEGEMLVIGTSLNNADVLLRTVDENTINFRSSDGKTFTLNSAEW